MQSHRIIAAILLFACLSSLCMLPDSAHALQQELDISDVQWRLSLNNTLIQSAGLPIGAAFVIDSDQADAPGSEMLIEALDGITFTLEQPPANAKLIIAINLNVQGDEFMPVPKGSCCFNATFETLVDGVPVDSGSMLVQMTIPSGEGLDYLLDLCGASWGENVVFAVYSGSSVNAGEVETTEHVSGLTARFFPTGMIIGGRNTDFGIPASVDYSTWHKVKKLFE